MSEEERQKIAGKVMFELSDKKKELACLRAKARQELTNMKSSVSLLGQAMDGQYPIKSGFVIISEDEPAISGGVKDLVKSMEDADVEIRSLTAQLEEMGL